jgi:membrane fusion protein (multidrug efflux system)
MLLAAVGCSHTSSAAKPPQPPSVEVTEVIQKDIPLYKEWIGTLDGLVNADIKAQVSGYLIKQDYTEGTFVKQGQLLFNRPRPPGGAGPGAVSSLQSQGQLERRPIGQSSWVAVRGRISSGLSSM